MAPHERPSGGANSESSVRREVGAVLPSVPVLALYRWILAGLLACLALTLLALLDFRRGFLFAHYSRSPYWAFHPLQLWIAAGGAAGMCLCHRALKRLEPRVSIPRRYGEVWAMATLGLLVADLAVYRAVPTARAVAAGALGADWVQAFGVSGWLRPFALAVSYVLAVWHASLIGVLIAGLAVTALPPALQHLFTRTGFGGTVRGALWAIPQPFCSCCAALVAPSYLRRGASTTFSLAFVVASPMLNVTAIILAFALLPVPFALTRLAAGIVLVTVVAYGAARFADRRSRRLGPTRLTSPGSDSSVLGRWRLRYLRLFDLDALLRGRRLDTPAALTSAWGYASVRLALVLLPLLVAWSIVTAAVVQLLPPAFGNNLPSVAVTAVAGTLLMIATWTEIPVALQLIHLGFTGPAATVLTVLPPVSLPCLMLLAGSLGRLREVVFLGLAVMVAGVLAGAVFLY